MDNLENVVAIHMMEAAETSVPGGKPVEYWLSFSPEDDSRVVLAVPKGLQLPADMDDGAIIEKFQERQRDDSPPKKVPLYFVETRERGHIAFRPAKRIEKRREHDGVVLYAWPEKAGFRENLGRFNRLWNLVRGHAEWLRTGMIALLVLINLAVTFTIRRDEASGGKTKGQESRDLLAIAPEPVRSNDAQEWRSIRDEISRLRDTVEQLSKRLDQKCTPEAAAKPNGATASPDVPPANLKGQGGASAEESARNRKPSRNANKKNRRKVRGTQRDGGGEEKR